MSRQYNFLGINRSKTITPATTTAVVVQKKVVKTEKPSENNVTKVVIKGGNKAAHLKQAQESRPRPQTASDDTLNRVEIINFKEEQMKAFYEDQIKELKQKVEQLENKAFHYELYMQKGYNEEKKNLKNSLTVIVRKLDEIKRCIELGMFGDAICEINILTDKIERLDAFDKEGINLPYY